MAELNEHPTPALQAAANISASTQLLAIAWLRWRIFANGFRRRNTGARNPSTLILTILLRLLLWPIFAMMAIGPAIAAGFLAWMTVSHHHPEQLVALLAGIALLWQFVAINGVGIAATVSTFDPASLLRFPLGFGRYLVLRVLLGLLIPSTILGCLILLSCAVGIAVADTSLAVAAVLVLAVYAAMNIFLARMIAAWMERWMAKRRVRELFGALMALFFVSFELLNVHHTAPHTKSATNIWLVHFLVGSARFLAWMPPGFAAASILQTEHTLARLLQFVALLLCTAVFFIVFALRLHKQFLGEYLSEGAARAAASTSAVRVAATPRSTLVAAHPHPENGFLSPAIDACLRKDWIYLRGSSTQLVRMLTPLIFVFIFSRGILARHPSYLISGAIGYALMTPMAELYSIFGQDGPGVQLYLLAPVRLRDVVVAKNIVSFAILTIEAALAWVVVRTVGHAPIPVSIQISGVFWIVFLIFVNVTIGTLRSIQSPRKAVVPGQTPRLRTPAASRNSALLVLAVLLGCFLLQIPVSLLGRHFHTVWLGAAVFAPLAAAAIAAYMLLLNNVDSLMLKYRDAFASELCGD